MTERTFLQHLLDKQAAVLLAEEKSGKNTTAAKMKYQDKLSNA